MMQRPSGKGVPELEIGSEASGAPGAFGAGEGVGGSSARGGGFGATFPFSLSAN